MSTRVTAMAKLNASCRRKLREKLRLTVDPTSELSRLNSILGSRQLALPDLQQLISAPSVSSVLSTLTPAEFGRVRARLADGRRSALETTAADLQTELAEILAIATAVVTATTLGIIATSFAESGLDLGYSTVTHHAESATRVELRRGREIVLVVIHESGNVEFNHGGLTEETCGKHQLRLEQAVERYGVSVSSVLSMKPGSPLDQPGQ